MTGITLNLDDGEEPALPTSITLSGMNFINQHPQRSHVAWTKRRIAAGCRGWDRGPNPRSFHF